MHNARVLVVDDSAAMRALFADVLDQAKNVQVVGTASSAEDARKQIESLKPNVLTLDVEMPGMSGIEFLTEVMEDNPMPVVMLSSLTQSGSEVALKAYALGAVECFPKPLKATPEQFTKMVGQLGKIVVAAANSNLRDRKAANTAPATKLPPFVWNGHIAVLSASMGGLDAVAQVLALFPANCPPTVIMLQTEPALAAAFVARAKSDLPCAVRLAEDGAQLSQGSVYVAADPDTHIVLEPGSPPRIRLLARPPVDGVRPSADLLFGSIARAGTPAVGAVLTGLGDDGAKGLKLLRDGGCHTFAESPATAMVSEAPAAAVRMGGVEQELGLADLGKAILARCSST